MRLEQATQVSPPSQELISQIAERSRRSDSGYRDFVLAVHTSVAAGSLLAGEPSLYIKFLPISVILPVIGGLIYLAKLNRAGRHENSLNQ